ncbi:MAG: hypothetical protein IAG13_09980 [Deltaproteobacteria bacterium]|nr:hypothetical protein [Nannocystaceae bacterium]
MLNLHKNHLALALSLVLTACPDDSGGSGDDGSTGDEDSDPTNGSTVSVTLTSTTQTSDTDPSTGPSTTVDPTSEGSNETAVDPDSSSGSGDASSDSGSESSSSGGTDDDTIYDIQMGVIADGTDVVVRDVVVTAVGSTRFWVQEPDSGEYSGILVFANDRAEELGVPALEIGDVVDISGAVLEYQDEYTEIDVSTVGTVEVTGTQAPLEPELIDIATLGTEATAEPWESTLVRIEGAFDVTDIDAKYDEITVTEGTDSVLIDDFIYNAIDDSGAGEPFEGLAVGATFTAFQGPVNFFIGEYKIMPRSADEFEGFSPPL